MWTKRKKKKKRRESIYLYFCTEETLGTKTLLVLCLHARSESRLYERHVGSSVSVRRTFLYKKGCFFFSLSSPQHSTHPGSTESIWIKFYTRNQWSCLSSFCWLCLIWYWVLTCQLWIECFCVVIYVLYTNIVHKMSLQREREIEERL